MAGATVERPPPLDHNAFTHRPQVGVAWEALKVVFPGIILAPVRMLLVLLFLLLATVFTLIMSIGLSKKDVAARSIPSWRLSVLRPYLWASSRAIMFCFGYYWVSVKGKRAPRSAAPISVANHVSNFEPLYFTAKGYAHVAKQEVVDDPTMRIPLVFLETIGVSREDRNSATTALQRIKDHVTRQPKEGELEPLQLMIYPEGTTSNGGFMARFKRGAFTHGVPVQPVAVHMPFLFFNPSQLAGTQHYLLRLLGQYIQFCQIEYLPVYVPSEEEVQNPNLYATNVRKVIANALNQGLSDCAVEDVLLAMRAEKKNLPAEAYIVEWGYFVRRFSPGFTLDRAKAAQDKFFAYDSQRRGFLREADLSAGLEADGIKTRGLGRYFVKGHYREADVMYFRDFLYYLCTRQQPFDELADAVFPRPT